MMFGAAVGMVLGAVFDAAGIGLVVGGAVGLALGRYLPRRE